MKVVSFYTPEYADEVGAWEASCEKFGLSHHAEAIENLGSWRLNCGYKALFLINRLHRYREPVLWVDIDGRFCEPWDLELDADYDFAIWFIPNRVMRPAHVPGGAATGRDGMASGTMWWNYTPASIEMLETWQKIENGQGRWEQQILGEAWYDHRPAELRTYRLPQEYCKVFDAKWFDGDPGRVVIEHTQASRKLKRITDRHGR